MEGSRPVYLDHAATTPVCAAALVAMAEAAAVTGNPSSVHSGGRAANALLEAARDTLARFANADAESIIFTSGGTEALALALHAAPRVLAGATEHSAVLAARPDAGILPVDTNGLIDLNALETALKAGPAHAAGSTTVAIQHANNETGVIQPLAAIADLVADHGGKLLVDAVQSAGKLALPAADFIALSAHKLGGPPGVGALIARDPGSVTAVQRGGGQERGRRGGTPNLPGIAGFAAALGQLPDWTATEARRNALEARLNTLVHGTNAPRLPNISNLALPGVSAQTQVMALDLAGFMVSAGAACSSGKVKTSHVLTAMGLAPAAGEAIRVSLGPQTTDAEIHAFAEAWLAMARRLSPKAAA